MRLRLSWDEFFVKLKDFYEINKRLPAKNSNNKDEHRLYVWYKNQKQLYSKDELNFDRAEALLEFNNEIFKNVHSKSWDERFKELKIFFEEKKTMPTAASKDPTEVSLAAWVQTQKLTKKSGKLLDERKKLLLDFDFDFFKHKRGHGYSDTWIDKFNDFKEFYEKWGVVPSRKKSANEDEMLLGFWASAQRVNNTNGKLLHERKELIIGVCKNFFETSLPGRRKKNKK